MFILYIYKYINFISGFRFKATSFQLKDSSVSFHNGKQRTAWIHFLKRTFSAILHQSGLFWSHLMIILPFNTALTNIPPTKGKGHSPDFILGRVDMLVQLLFCNNLRLKKGRRCFFLLDSWQRIETHVQWWTKRLFVRVCYSSCFQFLRHISYFGTCSH